MKQDVKPSPFEPVRPEWLSLTREDVLEPELAIVDAHHHLWDRPECPYLLADLLADTANGHRIVATVFVECRARYRPAGERALRSLGETEFAAAAAQEACAGGGTTRACAGIVAFADLQLGPAAGDLVDAHLASSRGRLRGIRNISARDPDVARSNLAKAPPPDLLNAQSFREGFATLAPRNLAFDAWMFHTQLGELEQLAEQFPDTSIVLNHIGGVLRTRRYIERPDEALNEWRAAMRRLASLPNVFVKLGGLGMPLFGFEFHRLRYPPSSETLANAWRPYIQTCIDDFGPSRCMFESNFPADKCSCSYTTLWNAFKRITTGYSQYERQQLFSGTASRVYRLPD